MKIDTRGISAADVMSDICPDKWGKDDAILEFAQ